MSWKDDFYEEFCDYENDWCGDVIDFIEAIIKEQLNEQALAYENKLAEVTEMYEEAIKETEQRILIEAYNLKQPSDYYGDIIDPDHILQLIEKYIKGVE